MPTAAALSAAAVSAGRSRAAARPTSPANQKNPHSAELIELSWPGPWDSPRPRLCYVLPVGRKDDPPAIPSAFSIFFPLPPSPLSLDFCSFYRFLSIISSILSTSRYTLINFSTLLSLRRSVFSFCRIRCLQ